MSISTFGPLRHRDWCFSFRADSLSSLQHICYSLFHLPTCESPNVNIDFLFFLKCSFNFFLPSFSCPSRTTIGCLKQFNGKGISVCSLIRGGLSGTGNVQCFGLKAPHCMQAEKQHERKELSLLGSGCVDKLDPRKPSKWEQRENACNLPMNKAFVSKTGCVQHLISSKQSKAKISFVSSSTHNNSLWNWQSLDNSCCSYRSVPLCSNMLNLNYHIWTPSWFKVPYKLFFYFHNAHLPTWSEIWLIRKCFGWCLFFGLKREVPVQYTTVSRAPHPLSSLWNKWLLL